MRHREERFREELPWLIAGGWVGASVVWTTLWLWIDPPASGTPPRFRIGIGLIIAVGSLVQALFLSEFAFAAVGRWDRLNSASPARRHSVCFAAGAAVAGFAGVVFIALAALGFSLVFPG